jgi:hypothetical protein
MNLSFKYQELSKNILYFTKIYKDKNGLISFINNLDWQEWKRNNGNRIGCQASILLEKNKTYHEKINIGEEIFKDYCYLTGINFNDYKIFSNPLIKKWDSPMGGMSKHTDLTYFDNSSEEILPAFTLSYYFTDEYEGGHLEFPELEVSIKPEALSVIVFPSLTPHLVTDLLSGERITGQDFVFFK